MKSMWIILPALFLAFSLVYTAVMYARVGTVGMDLYATERKIDRLKHENELLEARIANTGSIAVLIQKAEGLGMTQSVVLVPIEMGQQRIAMLER